MRIVTAILAELRHEAGNTRRLLERVPDSDLDWKPHPKSMTLRELSSHIVDSLRWTGPTITQEELEIDPQTFVPWRAKSRDDLVATLDRNLEEAIAVLEEADDEALLVPWTMKVAGRTIFTLPRIAVLRSFVLNHHIHHRGQLEVYLRLRDVPLPQIYGPTADEPSVAPDR